MGDRNIYWLPPVCAPTRDRTHNLGMCPDGELKPQHFHILDDAPTNRATNHNHLKLIQLFPICF